MVKSTSNFLMGKTTLSSTLSCDRVSDGAFFPQPNLLMPEEEMGQHACEHMMMPAGKFSHLIVVHTQFSLCFLKALFNGPAQPTEPDQCFEPDTGFARWSLRLLADKAVELNYIDNISHEAIRRILKKTSSNRGNTKGG